MISPGKGHFENQNKIPKKISNPTIFGSDIIEYETDSVELVFFLHDIIRRMESTPTPPEKPFENNDTVVFKRSHFYSVMVTFAFAVGLLVGYVAWGRNPVAQQAVAVPAQAQAPSGQQNVAPSEEQAAFTRYDIPTEGFPSLGPDGAEIVIVEFSDYQ